MASSFRKNTRQKHQAVVLVILGTADMAGCMDKRSLDKKLERLFQAARECHELFEAGGIPHVLIGGLTDSAVKGTYVASSPYPVSQAEFMRELRRAVRMPIGLPAFSWMVQIGARFLLRTDPELALYGRYVVSRRLEEEGFEFQLPHLREALQDLLDRR